MLMQSFKQRRKQHSSLSLLKLNSIKTTMIICALSKVPPYLHQLRVNAKGPVCQQTTVKCGTASHFWKGTGSTRLFVHAVRCQQWRHQLAVVVRQATHLHSVFAMLWHNITCVGGQGCILARLFSRMPVHHNMWRNKRCPLMCTQSRQESIP